MKSRSQFGPKLGQFVRKSSPRFFVQNIKMPNFFMLIYNIILYFNIPLTEHETSMTFLQRKPRQEVMKNVSTKSLRVIAKLGRPQGIVKAVVLVTMR